MSKHRATIFSKSDCLSLEVILRYTQDQSIMKERNSVERHMLDCELCKDAVEGYVLMTDQDKASYIVSDLNKSLEVKSSDGFVIRRIAAGVGAFIILGGGLFYLNQNLTTKDSEVAVSNIQYSDSISKHSSELNIQRREEVIAMDKEVEVSGAERKPTFDEFKNKEFKLEKGNAVSEFEIKEGESTDDLSAPTLEKKDVLGAVSSTSAEELKDIPETDAAQAITGRMAGVNVTTRESGSGVESEMKSKKSRSKAENASADMAESGMLDQAIQKYNEKKYLEASVLIEQYLKTDSDNSKALYYNGLSYFDAGKWKNAIDNFNLVNKSSEFYEEARWKKAMALINKGDKVVAKKVFLEITESESIYKQRALEELKKL